MHCDSKLYTRTIECIVYHDFTTRKIALTNSERYQIIVGVLTYSFSVEVVRFVCFDDPVNEVQWVLLSSRPQHKLQAHNAKMLIRKL